MSPVAPFFFHVAFLIFRLYGRGRKEKGQHTHAHKKNHMVDLKVTHFKMYLIHRAGYCYT